MLRTLQPMVDFAGRRARRLDIWDVTMAPDGTLWFAAVIGFQSHRVSHIIANYDANGKPKKVWDMFPYHHHQIAVDESGKVYAFGHRIDAQQTPPYPLLIRYTARGQIDAPLLTAADLPEYDDPDGMVDGGKHELVVGQSGVTLLLDGVNEFVRIADGRIERRTVRAVAEALWGRSATTWAARGLFRDGASVVAEFVGAVAEPPDSGSGSMTRFVRLDSNLAGRQIYRSPQGGQESSIGAMTLGTVGNLLLSSKYRPDGAAATISAEPISLSPPEPR